MKIDIIYIPCYRLDLRLTRICVASIRHWYPEIPIVLVKDLMARNFDTTEIEKYFNVSVFPQEIKKYGWGFSKLEVFFQQERKRFLMLDSDIVMAGPILDLLEKYDDDWIVCEEPVTGEDLYLYYFNPDNIKKIDPEFNFPNFVFNTGQMVGHTGLLKRVEFDRFIEWKEPRVQLFRDAFSYTGEQPLLNYIIMKKADKKELTLRRLNFMRDGRNTDTQQVSIERLKKKEGYPFIIHWHDKKPGVFEPLMDKIPRYDILLYFEDKYYRGARVSPYMQYLRIHYEEFEHNLAMKRLTLSNRLKKFFS